MTIQELAESRLIKVFSAFQARHELGLSAQASKDAASFGYWLLQPDNYTGKKWQGVYKARVLLLLLNTPQISVPMTQKYIKYDCDGPLGYIQFAYKYGVNLYTAKIAPIKGYITNPLYTESAGANWWLKKDYNESAWIRYQSMIPEHPFWSLALDTHQVSRISNACIAENSKQAWAYFSMYMSNAEVKNSYHEVSVGDFYDSNFIDE